MAHCSQMPQKIWSKYRVNSNKHDLTPFLIEVIITISA
jgi:hypothetical protein